MGRVLSREGQGVEAGDAEHGVRIFELSSDRYVTTICLMAATRRVAS
jgi:hypothetical protein